MTAKDWTEAGEHILGDLNEIKPPTSFMLGLPDTIEKVTIKMGGRTVEFDVNKFMDMLESFKNDFCVEKKQWEIKVD